MKKKITYGFVVQTFDDDGKCTDQEFVAGEDVDFENEHGDYIDEDPNLNFTFDMIQPH